MSRLTLSVCAIVAACGSAATPQAQAGPQSAPQAAGTHANENGPALSTAAGGDRALAAAPKHPTPFTAEQIRGATKAGRTYRYRVEVGDKPPSERVISFVSVDADGAVMATPGEPNKRVTWEQLRQHAEFPAPLVMTREESITTPAGKFDCIVYVVLGEDGEASTFYFAKTLPGAPVQFSIAKEGRRVMISTLVEHRPGK